MKKTIKKMTGLKQSITCTYNDIDPNNIKTVLSMMGGLSNTVGAQGLMTKSSISRRIGDPSKTPSDEFIHAGALIYTVVEHNATDTRGEGSCKLLFLLGKEHEDDYWDDGGKWSSMGGKPEKGEMLIDSAAREVYEEGMGVFGNEAEIKEKLRNCEHIYTETPRDYYGNTGNKSSITFLLPIYYDSNLPTIWKSVYQYIEKGFSRTPARISDEDESWEEARKGKKKGYNRVQYFNGANQRKSAGGNLHLKAEEGFFEKTEIAWVFASDLYYLVMKTLDPKWYQRQLETGKLKWENPAVASLELREAFARTMLAIYEKYPEFKEGCYQLST